MRDHVALVEPPLWRSDRTLGDKLQMLARISKHDLDAIEILVDDVLKRRLWQQHDALVPSPQKPRLLF